MLGPGVGPLQAAHEMLLEARVRPHLGPVAEGRVEDAAAPVVLAPGHRVVPVRSLAPLHLDRGDVQAHQHAHRVPAERAELVDLVLDAEVRAQPLHRRVPGRLDAHLHVLVPRVAVEEPADERHVGRVLVEGVGRRVHTGEGAPFADPLHERRPVLAGDRQLAGRVEEHRVETLELLRVDARAVLGRDDLEPPFGRLHQAALRVGELIGRRSPHDPVRVASAVGEEEDPRQVRRRLLGAAEQREAEGGQDRHGPIMVAWRRIRRRRHSERHGSRRLSARSALRSSRRARRRRRRRGAAGTRGRHRRRPTGNRP